MQKTSSWLLSLALLLIPLGIWFALEEPQVWQERLVIPRFDNESNRHTPLHVQGTFLPPVIAKNQILTAADNPVILAKTVRVPTGVTLTIEAGAHVYAHEYALLDIQGELKIKGTAEQPVRFSSNEQHPDNQIWGGIIFEPGSRGIIIQARFKAAYPTIACLPGSQVTIDGLNCVY